MDFLAANPDCARVNYLAAEIANHIFSDPYVALHYAEKSYHLRHRDDVSFICQLVCKLPPTPKNRELHKNWPEIAMNHSPTLAHKAAIKQPLSSFEKYWLHLELI